MPEKPLKYLPIEHQFPDNRLESMLRYFEKKINIFYSKTEIKNIFDDLCEHWLGENPVLPFDREKRLNVSELLKFYKSAERLAQGEPLAYITEKKYFYKYPFWVTPSVLIPRPETEELTEQVIQYIKAKKKNNVSVLDLCTGSGCIAITLKKEIPEAIVAGLDSEAEALQVAQRNSELLDASVEWIHADVMQWNGEGRMWDILISNPPYIPIHEKNTLPVQVRKFEPEKALFTNSSPMEFYERIFQLAATLLNSGGRIFLECHQNYAHDVLNLSGKFNFLNPCEISKDLSGNLRFFKGTLIS